MSKSLQRKEFKQISKENIFLYMMPQKQIPSNSVLVFICNCILRNSDISCFYTVYILHGIFSCTVQQEAASDQFHPNWGSLVMNVILQCSIKPQCNVLHYTVIFKCTFTFIGKSSKEIMHCKCPCFLKGMVDSESHDNSHT